MAFCLLEVVANFDAGILPACQVHVSKEFQLSHDQSGLLGGLVYLGMVIGTPIAGYYLTNSQEQAPIIAFGALFNSIAILIFAHGEYGGIDMLYLGRTLMGVSQGPIFVYAPVWVDQFSPVASQALWMALLQGSVVLGIVLGYMMAG